MSKKDAEKQSDNQSEVERREAARKRQLAGLRPFKPGQSGNPKGRPPKKECMTSLAKEMMNEVCPLICRVYEANTIDPEILIADLDAVKDNSKDNSVEIPDYAYDCHTARGKRMGRTKEDFFKTEFKALNPREPGLFDFD